MISVTLIVRQLSWAFKISAQPLAFKSPDEDCLLNGCQIHVEMEWNLILKQNCAPFFCVRLNEQPAKQAPHFCLALWFKPLEHLKVQTNYQSTKNECDLFTPSSLIHHITLQTHGPQTEQQRIWHPVKTNQAIKDFRLYFSQWEAAKCSLLALYWLGQGASLPNWPTAIWIM